MTNVWTDNEEANLLALIDGYGLASVLDKMAALSETQAIVLRDDDPANNETKALVWDRAVGILDMAKNHFTLKDFDDSERAYILEQAKQEWASDECEIFENSLVTRSPDEGAWIEAKVFVSLEFCANPECGAIEGTAKWGTVGDGYDGYCPACADKREGGDS